jgi:RNA polymerase sigma factor (sigma-70 family)
LTRELQSPVDTLNEGLLWSEFKNSNSTAFGEIYGQYSYILLQYGKRLCPDKMVVQDAIHDLFIDLWKMRHNLTDNVSIRFYLYRSLRRRLHTARKQEQLHQYEALEFNQFSGSHETSLINLEAEERQSKIVLNALTDLSGREKEVVQLRYFDNKPVKEIARLLQIKEQTVRNLLQRALLKIRKKVTLTVLY